ncbi:cytochrome bd-I oxidase subunit CydX [Chitinasiproducens palmae]|uniref:Cyd operon protein YbgT n=1 Tax=Chitinasiproducens palmae TaxID=1770053 RepID=A0A1H2PP02_9BURK|nr:cytochrome bd-I oxidase subunit CydX [Chitinasiproducens palmae]SDV48458.1 cyd operon protein YbgT [Chitinasiproducens palmae]
MWYFTWILGVGVALAFGLVSALWFEARGDFAEIVAENRIDKP